MSIQAPSVTTQVPYDMPPAQPIRPPVKNEPTPLKQTLSKIVVAGHYFRLRLGAHLNVGGDRFPRPFILLKQTDRENLIQGFGLDTRDLVPTIALHLEARDAGDAPISREVRQLAQGLCNQRKRSGRAPTDQLIKQQNDQIALAITIEEATAELAMIRSKRCRDETDQHMVDPKRSKVAAS